MAGRPQKSKVEIATDSTDSLIKDLWSLCESYQNDILKSEIKQLIYYAEIIKEKLPKINRLALTMGRKYVKITDDGQIEEISFDEGYRKIMGYLPKGETVIGKLKSERSQYLESWYEFVKWRESNSTVADCEEATDITSDNRNQ